MRVEWKCASMTSGEQCVMTSGTALMLLLSANNWDMHTLEVSVLLIYIPSNAMKVRRLYNFAKRSTNLCHRISESASIL